MKPKAGHLIALGAFAAALGVALMLDACQWWLAGDWPGHPHAGVGVRAGVTPTRLAGGLVLTLVGAGVALHAALRGGRLK